MANSSWTLLLYDGALSEISRTSRCRQLTPDDSESFNQDEIALFIVDGHAAGA